MEKRNIAISLPSTGEDEWLAVREPLESGWLTQGPKVNAFEKQFAEMHEVKYGIATTSCTTGLHLILAAMDIGPGDEVIVPAFTWVATANVVMYCGATPVFIDVDVTTNNIDPQQLKQKVSDKTKAVIAVHLFGLCADIDAIRAAIPAHVKIIEDAACAAGASLNGVMAGGLGDAAAFSFHPRKSITTGEGGMVTTNDDALADKMIKLRNHGAEISEEQRHQGPKPYLLPEFNLLGFNYRMTDLQGAVGLVQLNKLEQFLTERRHWADYYKEQLADIDWLEMPALPVNGKHAWQAFVMYVNPEKAPMSRNDMMEILQEKGISTRPGTHAVHMLGYYADKFGLSEDDFPNAKLCNNHTMAIPLHNRMTKEDYDYVVDAILSLR
ncbi:DegT/DnrJ/EryC1/StrS family aminotransferase [Paraneptunicella aestuarii]|uniref:DegT/DnrJ/EryC1/StrS family aminotransferase n=1 Tax=Paraneptunicella aestuarii TaxID=2831148 RepID=UPI001E383916|nr:DegT/DnrJ/EryC1/StrS family aminotransferase [Paraneptunicella aestuarii]UAA39674.1 DegT/DnrJ/EryC1/StrS family aminotransferase [Paraneptunicella aestuarii]